MAHRISLGLRDDDTDAVYKVRSVSLDDLEDQLNAFWELGFHPAAIIPLHAGYGFLVVFSSEDVVGE